MKYRESADGGVRGSAAFNESNQSNALAQQNLAVNINFAPEEQYYRRRVVSGITCLVQAVLHNGVIKGWLSAQLFSQ